MGFSRVGATDKAKNACAIKVTTPHLPCLVLCVIAYHFRLVLVSPSCLSCLCDDSQSCQKEACMGISIRFCEEHYEEFRSSLKSGFGKGEDGNENEKITLQQQVALLKKQLQDSGQQPVEFVELSVARQRMQEAVQRLIGGDEAAEKEIEKWDKAIRMNPEYQVSIVSLLPPGLAVWSSISPLSSLWSHGCCVCRAVVCWVAVCRVERIRRESQTMGRGSNGKEFGVSQEDENSGASKHSPDLFPKHGRRGTAQDHSHQVPLSIPPPPVCPSSWLSLSLSLSLSLPLSLPLSS
jgi:hypothetical protein